MATEVRDNPEKSRYEIYDDGELAGFSDYQLGKDMIAITHTEIDEAFGGKGLGKMLATDMLADVRTRGLALRPFCSYVRKVVERNTGQYLDLVRPEDRARFDLPEEAE
jgi:predicted GNAT family acetyltransferase